MCEELKLDNRPAFYLIGIPLFCIGLLKYVTNCRICLNSSIATFEGTAKVEDF